MLCTTVKGWDVNVDCLSNIGNGNYCVSVFLLTDPEGMSDAMCSVSHRVKCYSISEVKETIMEYINDLDMNPKKVAKICEDNGSGQWTIEEVHEFLDTGTRPASSYKR